MGLMVYVSLIFCAQELILTFENYEYCFQIITDDFTIWQWKICSIKIFIRVKENSASLRASKKDQPCMH